MSSVCVIGAGRWGKNHITTLHNLGYLGGIVESNLTVLAAFQEKFPHVPCFSTVAEALNEDFNGFTIATPAETHFAIAKQVMTAGKHVLVEKPLTLKAAEAVALKEMAASKKVNLMVGHVLLFHPAFQKIKQMLTDGTLGKLQYLYSNRINLGTIRTEENVFWSFAPHDIALFQYLTESMPVKVTSRGMDILQDGVHDTTITTLEYPGKTMGHIFVSWLHPFKEHRFVVVGSKGMIRFEDSQEGKPLVYYDKSVSWQEGKPIPRSGAAWFVEYDNTMPLTAELKYFTDHLNGDPIAISNGESAVEVMKILEDATENLNR